MDDEPAFMVHSQRWQDDQWNYENDALFYAYEEASITPPITPRMLLAWWLALALVATGGLLLVVAAALFCRVVGL